MVISIISNNQFKTINTQDSLIAPDSKLFSYNGDTMPTNGKIKLQITHANRNSIDTDFYIVNKSAIPLIGLQPSIDTRLIELTYSIDNNTLAMTNSGTEINKQTAMKNYCDLFKGIGMIPEIVKLHLKDDAVPTINPPCHIPKRKAKIRTRSFAIRTIITKVLQPIDWVNPLWL